MAKKPAAKTVRVKRVGSPLRREPSQLATLVGLGLTRANKIVELENTPAVQGMIRKVGHLVEVVSSE